MTICSCESLDSRNIDTYSHYFNRQYFPYRDDNAAKQFKCQIWRTGRQFDWSLQPNLVGCEH